MLFSAAMPAVFFHTCRPRWLSLSKPPPIEISPLRGEARKPSFSEIRCNSEVARRLANGGVKKSMRMSVKNGELFEAARNGVSAASFHRLANDHRF